MSIEVMRQALEALEYAEAGLADIGDADREPGDDLAWCERRAAQALPKTRITITALRQAIEQAEQVQPVAWRTFDGEGGYEYRTYDLNEGYAQEWAERNPRHVGWVDALYTAPPPREWVGLTPEEVKEISLANRPYVVDMVRALEQRLKEKNT